MWTRAQVDAGAAPASVKRRLAALSSFYAHCAEHGLAEGNPTAGVRRAEVNPDHVTTAGLSGEQTRALLAAARAPGEARCPAFSGGATPVRSRILVRSSSQA